MEGGEEINQALLIALFVFEFPFKLRLPRVGRNFSVPFFSAKVEKPAAAQGLLDNCEIVGCSFPLALQ